jgi:pimeloyl-ACP methyl ester carboxylesterase
MDNITLKDGTQIYYKDWGTGQPLFFHHGWPLSADDWDAQLMFFPERGYRVIAHDRRGHGRSTQTVTGNDMDTYAADVAELVQALDLKDAVHIGHSTGGGEVIRYVARHGKTRTAKAIIISAIPPGLVKSDRNTGSVPMEVFDGITQLGLLFHPARLETREERSQFPGSAVSRRGAISILIAPPLEHFVESPKGLQRSQLRTSILSGAPATVDPAASPRKRPWWRRW